MALDQAALNQLLDALRSGGDLDFMREAILQALIDLEATEKIGAARHERTDNRSTHRNGSRSRLLSWWAFSAINVSPGARAPYDALRKRGATHHQGLRAVGNRLVGILHGCLHPGSTYSEAVAWPAREPSGNSADDRAA